MKKRWLTLYTALMVVSGLTACKKSPTNAPEYSEASSAYSTLVAELGDDAYFSDRIQRVETLLKSVPADSLDAQAAGALMSTIASERARATKERELAARARAEALRPPENIPLLEQPKDETPVTAAAIDAGLREPYIGMPLAEFEAVFGDCFSYSSEVGLEGSGGDKVSLYTLRDVQRCEAPYKKFQDSLIIIQNGKVLNSVPKANLKREYRFPDGGVAPTPTRGDGGG